MNEHKTYATCVSDSKGLCTTDLINPRIHTPPRATWEWSIHGDWHAMTVRLPLKTGRFWWLHRTLQRWLLGIH